MPDIKNLDFVNRHIYELFHEAERALFEKQKEDLCNNLIQQLESDAKNHHDQIRLIRSSFGDHDALDGIDASLNALRSSLKPIGSLLSDDRGNDVETHISDIAQKYLFFLNQYRNGGAVYHNASAYLKPNISSDIETMSMVLDQLINEFDTEVLSRSTLVENDDLGYDISPTHFVTSWEGMVYFYQLVTANNISYTGYMKLLLPDFSGSLVKPSVTAQARFCSTDNPYNKNVWEQSSLIHIHQDYWASDSGFWDYADEGDILKTFNSDEYSEPKESDDEAFNTRSSRNFEIDLESILFNIMTYRFHKMNNSIFFFTYTDQDGEPITPLGVSRYLYEGYNNIFNNYAYPSLLDII